MTSVIELASHVRDLVQRHHVLWSILPKHLPASLNGQRIGFDIELWGSHTHPSDAGHVECSECRKVVESLNEIASYIAPDGCEFRTGEGGIPVDVRQSFHPRNGFGRSVKLGIEVVCRGGHSAVASQCDGGCLFGMRGKLEALGARRI